MTPFRIWSDNFENNGYCGKEQELNEPSFGANGKNLSPSLHWEGVPSETKSLALTVYDPDAPTGSGFWHWVVVNLPVELTSLAADAGSGGSDLLPTNAIQLLNDYGKPGFGGFAPPQGDKAHRYIFCLHALKVSSLPVTADGTTNAVARFMIHLNQLDFTTVTGLYEIPKT